MSNFSKERLDQIWNKGRTIRGKDPDLLGFYSPYLLVSYVAILSRPYFLLHRLTYG
jgi:hypothetical protein